MAIISQIIEDGPRNHIRHVSGLDTDSGAPLVITFAALAANGGNDGKQPCNDLDLEELWFGSTGPGIIITWQGATPAPAWATNSGGEGYWDFRIFGGIRNNAVTPNGTVTITPTAAPAGTFTTVVHFKKKYA